VLEDVDRIEVISGPGGVLWGANAVNGVINILTKSASATQGWMLSGGVGQDGSFASARYGGASENGHYRVYAKTFRWDNQRNPAGANLRDGLDRMQGGFRSDWTMGSDSYTLQGDAYTSTGNQVPRPSEFEGVNLLGRWRRDFGDGENLRVQAYYDWSKRPQQDLTTFDLDVAYTMRPRGAHRLLWGGGARQARDEIANSAGLAFFPADKTLSSWNIYVQDEIALSQTLEATLGAKVDRNSYTGTEFLPSARLAWRPSTDRMVWGAWSRAVRIPSRFDKDLFLPGAPPFLLAGGPTFQSEISYVYELGYRAQPFSRLSWSATAFYHDLQKQRTIAPGPAGALVSNDREGHTSGIEGWSAWRITDYWRLEGGYTHQRTKLNVVSGGIDLQPAANIASDPSDWWKLRTSFDLGKKWELDLMARHYGWLFSRNVPSYTAVDARLAWKVSPRVEVSLVVQNLLDDKHIEWAPGAEFRRNGFLRARLDL
jgi:iron complex outermembrane receptor protein